MKVELKDYNKKPDLFSPKRYSIEITIETQQELKDLKLEFSDGYGFDKGAEYSDIYAEVLEALFKISKL